MTFILVILLIRLLVMWIQCLEEAGEAGENIKADEAPDDEELKPEVVMFNRKMNYVEGLFRDHYLEVKTFYALQFNRVPCVSFIGELDTSKVFSFIEDGCRDEILAVYQHNWFDHNERKLLFNNTVFVFREHRMIELGPNYCHVLHRNDQYGWATHMANVLAAYRAVPETKENRVIGFTCNAGMN